MSRRICIVLTLALVAGPAAGRLALARSPGSGLLGVAGGRVSLPGVASLTVRPGELSRPLSVVLDRAPVQPIAGLFPGEIPLCAVRVRLTVVGGAAAGGVEVVGTGRLRMEGAPAGLAAIVRSGQAPGPQGELQASGDGFMPAAGLSRAAPERTTTAEVPLMTGLSEPETYTLVDLSRSRELVQQPELREVPDDPEPLGSRRAVFLAHGIESRENPHGDVEQGGKVKTWDALRASPRYRALRPRCKFYMYLYPTYRSPQQNAEDMVRLIDARIGLSRLADNSALIVAHSMGGLVSRRAMRLPGFGGKVHTLVTMATPHHGALPASVLYAGWKIHRKIGWFWTLVVKGARWLGYPDTAGLRSLWWDNLDGGISETDRREYGVAVSAENASFNRSEPNAGKIVCLMGDIKSLAGHGMLGSAEIVRRGIERYEPRYRDVDPQVTKASGTFAGTPVRATRCYRDVDHNQIPADAAVLSDLFDVLTAAARE